MQKTIVVLERRIQKKESRHANFLKRQLFCWGGFYGAPSRFYADVTVLLKINDGLQQFHEFWASAQKL